MMKINSYHFNVPANFFSLSVIASAMLILSLSSGCANRADKLIACENRITKLEQQNEQLTRELAKCHQQLQSQKRQIRSLQGFSADKLKYMIKLERIRFARLTGGYDSNHDGYDDGVVVYLQPVDTDGHIVKVAGSVSVRLFSLCDKPEVIGQVTVPPSELQKHWSGTLWTNHYTIKCPFKTLPPTNEVTVRVEFIEFLTGKTFIAQKRVTVKIPPKK